MCWWWVDGGRFMFPYFMKKRERKLEKRKNMKKKFEHREMIRKKSSVCFVRESIDNRVSELLIILWVS